MGKRIQIRKGKRLLFSGDREGTIMERRQRWNYGRKETLLGQKEAKWRAGGGGWR